MNGVRAVYGAKFWALVVVMIAFTFGFGVFIWLWMRTMWIATADDQGVTTVSGRRFSWSELTNVEHTTMTAVGARVGGVGGLQFGKKKVLINTMLLSNTAEVVNFVGTKVGGPVTG